MTLQEYDKKVLLTAISSKNVERGKIFISFDTL